MLNRIESTTYKFVLKTFYPRLQHLPKLRQQLIVSPVKKSSLNGPHENTIWASYLTSTSTPSTNTRSNLLTPNCRSHPRSYRLFEDRFWNERGWDRKSLSVPANSQQLQQWHIIYHKNWAMKTTTGRFFNEKESFNTVDAGVSFRTWVLLNSWLKWWKPAINFCINHYDNSWN